MVDFIRQEYLDMAFKVVARINLSGQVCNHVRFYNKAFWLYLDEIKKRPILMEYLGRAFRELPKKHPDVERIDRDMYVVRQLRKYCEQDYLKEKFRRMGGKNGELVSIPAVPALPKGGPAC